MHRRSCYPLNSAAAHLHLIIEKRPVLAAVRSNIEFITELTVRLSDKYILRAGNHSFRIRRAGVPSRADGRVLCTAAVRTLDKHPCHGGICGSHGCRNAGGVLCQTEKISPFARIRG